MFPRFIQDIGAGNIFFKDINTRMIKTEMQYGFNCYNIKTAKYEYLPIFTKVYTL